MSVRKLEIKDFNPSAELNIWDVRDAEAYRAGHIAHAVNKPVDQLSVDDLAAATGSIYVLCGGGTKAERAVALLNDMDGSRDIVHLTGGTRGAKALGWTLMTED